MIALTEKAGIAEVVSTLNREFALVLLDGEAVVAHETADVDGRAAVRFLSIDAFRLWFGNRRVDATTGCAPETFADAWLGHPWRRTFAGVTDVPDREPGDFLNIAGRVVIGGDPRQFPPGRAREPCAQY